MSSVAAFSSLWDFLALLLEDFRTWTVEYPKGGHGSGPQILIEHQGTVDVIDMIGVVNTVDFIVCCLRIT